MALSALTACGSDDDGGTSGSGGTTKVTVATVPTESGAQTFYAQARRFFAREGLDAKIEIVRDPAQLAAAVLSGEAQFAVTSSAGLGILHGRDAPIELVAAGALYRPTAPTTALVSSPGSGVRTARDLAGKSIAIDQRNSTTDVALRRWLGRNGVPPDEVTIREIPFAAMLGPITKGSVDAAVVPEPFLTLTKERGARTLDTIFDVVCERACLLTGWFARKDFVAENPETVAKFRRGVEEAAQWANNPGNHKASGDILARYAPIPANVLAKMQRIAYGTRLQPEQAQPWIDAMAEQEMIPEGFDARSLTG